MSNLIHNLFVLPEVVRKGHRGHRQAGCDAMRPRDHTRPCIHFKGHSRFWRTRWTTSVASSAG